MKRLKGILFIIMIATNIFTLSYLSKIYKFTNDQLNMIQSVNNHRPSVPVSIHYTALDGSRKEISTYDDRIDVGNDIINVELTSLISYYRDEYMLCSCNLLDVTVNETTAGGADITIDLPGSIHIRFIDNINSKDG